MPLLDTRGHAFTYSLPDPALEMLHRIDQRASGRIAVSEAVTNPETRERYVISSLIEEAITSSQLEGASTTGVQARELLRSGRSPRDRGERMIVGNYEAMRRVRELSDVALTPQLVTELHHVVTRGTLDDSDGGGGLQGVDEERVAVLWDQQVLHRPPAANELPARMELMCAFANSAQAEGFLHPVIRAIVLHFWLAYDHPFVDGNGRTARALFYWSMLSQGYWLAEYLSISSILRAAPARYAKSFLYVETDEGDVTYFLLAQLRVIMRSLDALDEYLQRKMREVREVETLLRRSPAFNQRQLALLAHGLRHPDAVYTFRSHATSHSVTYQSARTDLLDLESKGLLERAVQGKTFLFYPVADLADRLRALR